MSIFGKIKDAIFGKAHAAPAPAPAPTVDTMQAPGTPPPSPETVPNPVSTSEVDVVNSLDSFLGADNLNWRTSIVDLMKLVGIPSDYESRKALAEELGRADYSGDAEDNVWLHRQVMQGLARNGGKVPAEYID